MPDISKDSSNPIRPYVRFARGAIDSNDLDRAIRKGDGDVCITGSRSFKERFVSWFPNASKWLGISLSVEEKSSNRAVSQEFVNALGHCLGNEEAGQILKGHMSYFAKGLPLTARKVADILLEGGLDRDASAMNVKNREAFYAWYQEKTGNSPKKGTPERDALRALVTGFPDAYRRELDEVGFSKLYIEFQKSEKHRANKEALAAWCSSFDLSYDGSCIEDSLNAFSGSDIRNLEPLDFAQVVLDNERAVLSELRSGAGMVFSSESVDELDQAIEDLKQDEADLKQALVRLGKLKDKVAKDAIGDSDFRSSIDSAIADVKARLEQTRADLYPKKENVIVLEKQGLPETMRASLADQYMEDALKWHEGSSYLDAEGNTTKDPEHMLIRSQGFGNDIGRCGIKLNGKTIPVDTDKADVVQAFRDAFIEKYGAEKGERYLMQLSNTLGQALFAGVLTRNMTGEGVTGDILSAVPGDDARYAAQVSYSIELKEDGVHVLANYKKPCDSITVNPMDADRLMIAADRDASYTEITLDLIFRPDHGGGNLFSLNEAGCSYVHKVVPKTHDQVRSALQVSGAP